MNFSTNKKVIKLFCLIAAVILMTSLLAGCKKDEVAPPTTEGDLNLNINLETEGATEPPATETQPAETEPVVNEKSATVTAQLKIRSAPSTNGSSEIGVLYAGDKVIVERREVVTGIQWAYISYPQTGWICMDFVEMDVPDAGNNNTSTPAGGDNGGTTNNEGSGTNNQPSGTTTSIKGVVTTGLNIRKEPSKTAAVVGAYAKGDVITILETSNGWGRTNKGWINLDYVNTTGNSTTNNGGNNNNNNNNN
ncbi:MAG: SH3 domain-containing protein, partial [Oscillospiraceae bacterium]|nr:SH3 domain-containing protein [Oscillospiraceae bacterium]